MKTSVEVFKKAECDDVGKQANSTEATIRGRERSEMVSGPGDDDETLILASTIKAEQCEPPPYRLP